MASYLLEISYTIITVALLYYFLSESQKKRGTKELITHWILFGFIYNFYSFSWLYTVYPLPWMKAGIIQLFGLFIVHLLVAVFSAICFFVVAISGHKKISQHFLPLVFATSLVAAEALRSLALSFLLSGKGTTIAFHFTAGTIGNALSTTPLVEFAYFGGTFALTFILGYLVYICLSKKNIISYRVHGGTLLLLLLVTHFLIPISLPKEGTKVGIITTDFPTPNENNYAAVFKEQAKKVHLLTLSLATASSTFIVYPEDSRYTTSLPPKEMADLYIMFNKTLFIDGDTVLTRGGYSTISSFYYPRGDTRIRRGKEFLLPFSEYVPFIFRPLIIPFIGKDTIVSYEKLHTFIPIHSKKSILFDGTRIGTLLCSEILSFSLLQSLKWEHPSIVFFQSHLEVFHNNPWFIMHLRSFSKVAAAQLRTTIISSTSGAPSFIISPYGTIIRTIETGEGSTTYTFTH